MRSASTGGGAVRDPGEVWRPGVTDHRKATRFHAAERLVIRFQRPEATYLCWLDCSDLGIEGTAFDFFRNEARIAFSPGENFRPDAGNMVRLNFATSAEILDRMVAAVRRNAR